jgi:hypothetical protein
MDSFREFELAHYGVDGEIVVGGILEADSTQIDRLSDWYYGNQQIMRLLDEDVLF